MKKKILVIICISILIMFVIISYFFYFKEDKVAILTYHNVVDVIEGDLETTVDISVEKFEKQIKWLHKHGFKTLTMDELYEWKVNNKKIPRKSIVITFDDGWKSYYTKAIPILEKYNMKSSVFVVWKYTKNSTDTFEDIYMNLNDINNIINNHKNTQILSHSFDLHDKENAESNNYELYNEDIKKVNKIQSGIKYYAFPFGYNNEMYIKALKDNNYKLSFTFGPYDFVTKNSNNYQIPRIGLFESTKDWKFKLKMLLEI